ncbi:MAG: Asp23/Gls24 family envelope stress response protein [Anaerolineae bacterium]
MSAETKLGKIEISPTAVASLASQAVLGCYGVVGMSSPGLCHGLAEVLRRDNPRRGVEARLINREIVIDLYVVIEYGTRISEVAHNIMRSVKFSVEKALGVPVARVNVHVQGLRISNRD